MTKYTHTFLSILIEILIKKKPEFYVYPFHIKKKQENVNPKSNDNFYALMFVIIDVLILLKQQSNVKSIFLSINTEGKFFFSRQQDENCAKW